MNTNSSESNVSTRVYKLFNIMNRVEVELIIKNMYYFIVVNMQHFSYIKHDVNDKGTCFDPKTLKHYQEAFTAKPCCKNIPIRFNVPDFEKYI